MSPLFAGDYRDYTHDYLYISRDYVVMVMFI